ncbi:MAG: tetratricopeptide repeat protein [Planctomycetota bacterium]|jgi:tetratricopeptide (TPR) repeat protein|nr:tetratricopeptide repeat protein [Planctomycetota bacterium]MDP6988274.1 tetratricopeptide repeat protein [Planctomycetota bacterium]
MRVGRLTGVEVALAAGLLAGLGYLAWARLAPAPVVPTPTMRFFERGDGMPVAEVDAEALGAFLVSVDVPPLSLPPPPIEAAVARAMTRTMAALGEERTAEHYGRFGQFFDALRMNDQTRSCFEHAVALEPRTHRWRHLLGRHLATMGELEAAEVELGEAVALDPAYLPSRWRLARLWAQTGRAEQAGRELEATLAAAEHPYPWCELAQLALADGGAQRARKWLESALERDPRHGRAHALMSQALTALGDSERAAAHARRGRYSIKSLDSIPDPIVREAVRETDSVSYHRIAARSSDARGAERVALWERICRADPANADDKIQLSNAYLDAGRAEEAIATLEEAMTQVPRGARFRLSRAQLALRLGDAPGALRFADEALEIDPGTTAALGVKCMALVGLGRAREAVVPAERALELAPDNPQIYLFVGSVYEQTGRTAEAAAVYRRGLAVDPATAGLREALERVE